MSPARLHRDRVLAAPKPKKSGKGAASAPAVEPVNRELTPAQRHRARVLGETTAIAVAAAPIAAKVARGIGASAYELMRARLGVDLRRLKEIQSIERKIALKAELLPGYADWIAGVLAADTDAQDDILVQAMVWTIDVGDYVAALPLCAHVLRHKLTLPERFSRTPATLIAELIAEAALKSLGQGETFDLDVLVEVELLTELEDMPDEVRAKLMKAIGIVQAKRASDLPADADGPAGQRRAALERALSVLRRALELNKNIGVKKEISRLEAEVRASVPPA